MNIGSREGQGYSARGCATVGCEILNPDGDVVAWTVNATWAEAVVDLLNGANDSEPSHGGTLPHCQGNFKRK